MIRTRLSPVFRLAVFSVLLLALFCSAAGGAVATSMPKTEDAWRAKLIGSLIRRQVLNRHYSHHQLDDKLSREAFSLFVKQVDPRKRFFLQADIEALEQYADRIDDEMRDGIIVLPQVAAERFRRRVEVVRAMVDELLAGSFDFERPETLETDPDKRQFCATDAELRDRWRKILKYDLANRYLTLRELAAEKKEATEADGKAAGNGEGEKKTSDPMTEAREKVQKSYHTFFDRLAKMKDREYFDRYFDAFARAFDPHSAYMPPQEKEDFDIHMKGSLEGIGARLQETDGMIKVVSIIPGGAAARQGELEAEDVILKVAQGDGEPVDIVGMRIREAVALIRGKKGTTVRLTVKKPDGRIVEIAIVRDVVQIEETFVKTATIPRGDKTYGYIYIPSFYRDFNFGHGGGGGRNATDDVRHALIALNKKSMAGLVLDLRNNGGGALIDAVNIAGLFIEDGPVVQVKEDDGRILVHDDKDPAMVYRGPLVVLVNQLSASASEILAAALQDYRRAVIVGSPHTHGKGTVQTIVDLDRMLLWPNMQKYKPLGALKVTIQKFYRITGHSTQVKGVTPDIILPDRLQHLEYGEKYLENALPWDTVPATAFEPVNMVDPARLRVAVQRSEKRVAANEKFQQIVEESERARLRRERTERSLRLADIEAERRELERDDDGSFFSVHGMWSKEDKEAARLGKRERYERWVEKVREDIYVNEAVAVLADVFGTDKLENAAGTH